MSDNDPTFLYTFFLHGHCVINDLGGVEIGGGGVLQIESIWVSSLRD